MTDITIPVGFRGDVIAAATSGVRGHAVQGPRRYESIWEAHKLWSVCYAQGRFVTEAMVRRRSEGTMAGLILPPVSGSIPLGYPQSPGAELGRGTATASL